MADEWTPETRDDAYRAIGRYVVAFSELIQIMRTGMCQRLMKPGDGISMAELAIGEATAGQITDSFFAMCEATQPFPDDDEAKIGRKLRARVRDVLNDRNDIAHGDWWIWAGEEPQPLHPPTLIRVKPSRSAYTGKVGPLTRETKTAPDLNAMTDDLVKLTRLVGEYGYIALRLGPPGVVAADDLRVRDIFVLKGKGNQAKVVREGPKAGKLRMGGAAES